MASSILPPQKRCTKCNLDYPATREYFYASNTSPDGLRPDCKDCKRATTRARTATDAGRATQRAYRERNREKIRSWKREAYSRNHEHILAITYLWRQQHPERHKEAKKRHYRKWRANDANRALDNLRKRQYSKTPRGKMMRRAKDQRRASIKRAAEGTYTSADIRALWERQQGKCHYCGVAVGDVYHVDHVVPLSRGGNNLLENLVIACPSCNLSKSDKLPHEWRNGDNPL